jgi:integrase-like protein
MTTRKLGVPAGKKTPEIKPGKLVRSPLARLVEPPGPAPVPLGLTTPEDTPKLPQNMSGVPDIRCHDLRHTAASLLFLKNVHVKKVSEMLGHAGIGITLQTYGHQMPTMQRDAARAMDEIFG